MTCLVLSGHHSASECFASANSFCGVCASNVHRDALPDKYSNFG